MYCRCVNHFSFAVRHVVRTCRSQHSQECKEKNHAGTVFVPQDFDLWPFDTKINGFLGLVVKHSVSSIVSLAAAVFEISCAHQTGHQESMVIPRALAILQSSRNGVLIVVDWCSEAVYGQGFKRKELKMYTYRVKWRHSNLWSRHNLHVVGHDVVLCEVNWWRFVTLFTIRYGIFMCTQKLTKRPALPSAQHRNKTIRNKNSSGNEIANVNFFKRRYCTRTSKY